MNYLIISNDDDTGEVKAYTIEPKYFDVGFERIEAIGLGGVREYIQAPITEHLEFVGENYPKEIKLDEKIMEKIAHYNLTAKNNDLIDKNKRLLKSIESNEQTLKDLRREKDKINAAFDNARETIKEAFGFDDDDDDDDYDY